MAAPQRVLAGHSPLFSRLEESRARTDSLFELLSPNSYYDRPIRERHRLIFYLGHLEAFDWNLLGSALDLRAANPTFDRLFAFGIDPVGGNLPTDKAADWPNIRQVENYNRDVRRRLDEALENVDFYARAENDFSIETLLNVAIEHRLMHAETLAYLFHGLAVDKLLRRSFLREDMRPSPTRRRIKIPRGFATLGQRRGWGENFGWDNEFNEQRIYEPEFSIDEFPVTNGDFLEFVRAGGYQERSFWKEADWEWKEKEGIHHPHRWNLERGSSPIAPDTRWMCRTMFGTMPLPASWPVYVSHAEASAYAAWAGAKLPTESQWHRAAYGLKDGTERDYPWGYTPPEGAHGNFHFKSWDPCPVDAHPMGASAFGVQDMVGNGWEWTSTVFGPLPGFEPFPFYRGYSADFFDGKHFVMKGGSARTDEAMLRRSFRNWFQPNYPHVFATFRCAES